MWRKAWGRAASAAASGAAAAPGLALAAGVAGVATVGSTAASEACGVVVPSVPAAVALGACLSSAGAVPAACAPGLAAASGTCLRAGIAAVGLKLSAPDVARLGAGALPAAALTVGAGLLATPALARAAGLTPRLGALLAAGTGICGITAVSAVAPAIGCASAETAAAVANVVAYGSVGMILHPHLARAAFPPGPDARNSERAGIFLGLAVHDTAQVMGAGMTYKQAYGDDATLRAAVVTKLTRNALLAGAVPYLAWRFAGEAAKGKAVPLLPGFLVAFLAMAALRSAGDASVSSSGVALGVLDADTWQSGVTLVGEKVGAQALMPTALAAVGLNTSARALRGVGLAPFVVGGAAATIVAGTGLAVVKGLAAIDLV